VERGSGSLVRIDVALLFGQLAAGRLVRPSLDPGPDVVGPVDRPGEPDELLAKVLAGLAGPDVVLDLPELGVDFVELGEEPVDDRAIGRQSGDLPIEGVEFASDVFELGRIGDPPGLDPQDRHLVEQFSH